MRFIISLLALILLTSCSISKQVTAPQPTSRVEYRTETVFEKDTVYLSLPPIEQSHQTLDTVSVLENRYAKSTAAITCGTLSHSLQVKPIEEPVAIDKKIIYRDSLIYIQLPPEMVEVPQSLTPWQSFKMKTGGLTIALLTLAIVIAILYYLSHSKLFKP